MVGFLEGAALGAQAIGGIASAIGFNDGGGLNIKERLRNTKARALEFGFNPLTALGAGVANVNPTPGGVPPLSSFGAISDALKGVDDIVSGRKAREDARIQLENDLLKVQIDNLRLSEQIMKGGSGLKPPSRAVAPVTASQPRLAPGPFKPPSNHIGSISDPTLVERSDGMTSGNPEAPTEMESDLWGWAREGSIVRNGLEIARRNIAETPRTVVPGLANPARLVTDYGPAVYDWFFGAAAPRNKPEKSPDHEKFMRERFPTVFD